jgi:hypothetical protein
VDKWDIGRKREVNGGVKLLVNVKKARNRSAFSWKLNSCEPGVGLHVCPGSLERSHVRGG